jgi:uncharacterized protein (TIGR03437 family)
MTPCGLVTFGLIAASWASAQTITVRSGNGFVGGTDSAVTFLLGSPTGVFGHAFTPTDFSSAQTGPAAFILSPNPLWIPALSSDPSAQWIGTNADAACCQGNTALYAISFQITGSFSAATLTLNWAADDGIGEGAYGPNTGVYLNGTGICGNSFPIGFGQQNTVTCNNIAPLLRVGTNWLYIEDGNAEGAAGLLFSATITTTGNGALSLNPGGVVDVASFTPGPVAPGSLVAAFGYFPLGMAASTSSSPWPLSLSGLSMQFDGSIEAPLYYVSGSQVNLQIPWELSGQTQTSLTASLNGQTTAAQSVSLASFAPGVFGMNAQGTGQGAILDSSYKLVDSSNPAIPGSTIIQIYCTGLGPVNHQPASGAVARSNPLSDTITAPSVFIGGVSASVLFSGLAPGLVGVYQVNALVPASVPTGDGVPVFLSMSGVTSNTVTVAIQSPMTLNPSPSITELLPPMAQAGSGPLTLTIIGSGFIPSSIVSFNGNPHQPVFVSDAQLTITLSASDLSTSGNFAVLVSNPSPGGGSSGAVNFNVSHASVPVPPAPTDLSPGSASPPGPTVSTLTPTLSWNASPTATGYTVVIVNTATGKSAGVNVSTTSIVGPTLTSGDTYEWGVAAFNSSGLGTPATPVYFTAVSAQTGLTGTWQGSWTSDEYLFVEGALSANLNQSGSTFTGTASYTGSPCFSGGSITGTINGSAISAIISVGSGQTVSLSATVNSTDTSISGTYSLSGGTCAPSGDAGTFSLSMSQ